MVRCEKGPARFTNARSGFVLVSHLWEWKLSGSLRSYSRFKLEAEAQSSSSYPAGLVEW